MSYLVLARKYRPKVFGEVVGQEHVTRTLANAFEQDRVHHGFLFCGPRGVGKTTAARILGKALNCEQGPTPTPCGECEPCKSIADGTAVDYFEMDGASNRGIDSIRDLSEAVRYQPAVLRKKVYVIDEVHMLTTEAFNALLKTLEEPPPHVTFVLATTEPHKIPNTILSRCQRYDFRLVSPSRLTEHLADIFQRESLSVEPGALALVVRESGGSVRDALSLCDQLISYAGGGTLSEEQAAEVLGVADRSLTATLVRALLEGNAQDALDRVAQAVHRGIDEVQIARALVRQLHDMTMLTAAPETTALIESEPSARDALREVVQSQPAGRIRRMFERALRACEELGQTAHPRLVLDLALVDLAVQAPSVPLAELVDRLAALERRLGGGGGGGGAKSQSKPEASAIVESKPAVRVAEVSTPSTSASTSQASSPREEPAPKVEPPAQPEERVPPAIRQEGSPLARWAKVITALEEQRKIALAGLYQQARVVSWVEDKIELAFPADSASSEFACEPEHVASMEEFLAGHLGHAAHLKVSLQKESEMTAESARSIVEAEREAVESERAEREEEARSHPIAKCVEATFKTSIQEVRTNG